MRFVLTSHNRVSPSFSPFFQWFVFCLLSNFSWKYFCTVSLLVNVYPLTRLTFVYLLFCFYLCVCLCGSMRTLAHVTSSREPLVLRSLHFMSAFTVPFHCCVSLLPCHVLWLCIVIYLLSSFAKRSPNIVFLFLFFYFSLLRLILIALFSIFNRERLLHPHVGHQVMVMVWNYVIEVGSTPVPVLEWPLWLCMYWSL